MKVRASAPGPRSILVHSLLWSALCACGTDPSVDVAPWVQPESATGDPTGTLEPAESPVDEDPGTPLTPAETGTEPTSAGLETPEAGVDPTRAQDAQAPSEPNDAATGDANPRTDGEADPRTGPPRCSGRPGLLRGKSEQSVMASGTRTFVHYAPADLDPDEPVPLVIVPHGYTQSGQAMFDITRYSDVADREGFVVMFPDGAPGSIGPWDVGRNVCGNGSSVPGSGDDQAFIDEMIAFADADQCIDREHMFVTGWSMGGYLSNHTGCLRDDIRAIGPHSAGSHDLSECPVGPKPVILFHFDPDGLIDYECGEQARDRWVEHNGCSPDEPEVRTVKGGSCDYYKGCPDDGQVAFCTFEIPASHRGDFLAGHAWSGGTPHSYSIEETESAAELGWEFFKTYAW